jgi:hypothetical protein
LASANKDFGPLDILGTNGSTIEDVELTATNGFKEVKQIEIGTRPNVAPAPSALLLGLLGISTAGGCAGWRKLRARSAARRQ